MDEEGRTSRSACRRGGSGQFHTIGALGLSPVERASSEMALSCAALGQGENEEDTSETARRINSQAAAGSREHVLALEDGDGYRIWTKRALQRGQISKPPDVGPQGVAPPISKERSWHVTRSRVRERCYQVSLDSLSAGVNRGGTCQHPRFCAFRRALLQIGSCM